MNYCVHITRRAEKDLSQALDYIEFSLKNPQAADSLLDEAEAAMSSLDYMPERYALVDDKLLSAWGIRYIQIKKVSGLLCDFQRNTDRSHCPFPLWKK